MLQLSHLRASHMTQPQDTVEQHASSQGNKVPTLAAAST